MELPDVTAPGWSFLRVSSSGNEGVSLLYQCTETGTHMLLGMFAPGVVTPQQETVTVEIGDREGEMIVGPDESRVLIWDDDQWTFMARFVLSEGFGEEEMIAVARSIE